VILARRELTGPNGEPVEAILEAPEERPDLRGRWECMVHIRRGDVTTTTKLGGADVFQALVAALDFLSNELRGCTWLPSVPGYSGFPRVLDGCFTDFDRLNRVVDEELDRQEREMAAEIEARRK
jgi:hypothetical protein